MRKWTFQSKATAKAIAELVASGQQIPELVLPEGSILKRHQWRKYQSAIHFSAPDEAEKCGRFNPPGGKIAVWYAADSALTAMAESYGRMFHLARKIAWPESALSQHYLCAVKVTREIKIIDVIRLCELLHIPLDSLENERYNLPQWLMAHLFALYQDKYAGIAYCSRHCRYLKCYAFWQTPGSAGLFSDVPQGMATISQYKEYDTNLFPPGWRQPWMAGDDMLELLLNFEIISETD
ncbi:RES family NAD+ phosphorylase [Kalamiella sp. sgz302252]|uniref:RES family NAD+ phosphorylase n=1 Tax=Pantoea sp. sgz302252 TaxID=3341827 RepID=UPI0036D3B124